MYLWIPDASGKPLFWDNMMHLGANFSGPWLCICDFNMILSQQDKMGGLPYASSSTDFFHEFVNSFGMIDLGFIGNPFTWSNHREGHQLIRQRLDRGMASSQWAHLFPSFSILHLPASASDHNPIFLNTVHYDSTLVRPFKFEEFWSHHPDCYSTISLAWSPPCFGSPGFILNQKLRSTKLALRLWNRISFGNIQHQILSLTSQLDALQQSTSLSTLSVQERGMRKAIDDLRRHEETLWRNKSREQWLTCKDLNMKFFHLSTVIKRQRTAIDFLKLSSGAWISYRQAIGNTLCAHFADLFTTSEPLIPDEMLNLFDTVISNEHNLSICSIPSEQEIHDSVFSIGATKAPGPDGFTGVFYQKYWTLIKPVVLSCVWNFFNKHHLLKEHNHTFIALVPKQLGPSMVHHFRPINLCNFIYKIISKILANRLKVLLHRFISPYQSAFVPSRTIQDNSVMAHELLHKIKSKRGRGGLMTVKIDMEKAFDRMEWDFLLSVMIKLGFHPTWVNWIRICVSSSSFSILLNGSPFGKFTPSRGLRQGDPLSPFLFILGTEVLSRLFHQQESMGQLKGICIAKSCPPINHLLFADDLIIFAKATSAEAIALSDCLHKYCCWSGQKVNSGKSSLLFSKNTSPASISSILGIIPFRLSPSRPFHLGLPLTLGSSRKEAFQPIIDQVLSKINGWRAKTLSEAG